MVSYADYFTICKGICFYKYTKPEGDLDTFKNKIGKRLALFGMSSVLAKSSFIGLGTNVADASDMGGEVPNEETTQEKGAGNIILMIADGIGPSAMTALR